MQPGGGTSRWTFGEAALPEVVALATELRELLNTVLALESAPPELSALTEALARSRRRLEPHRPADWRPRVGPDAVPDQRVYLDHSRDVGAYHPCFPVYALECADDHAEGEVEFPLCYEGPPGIVHGGFLALFFDCVLQQLNCDLGVAGKTTALHLRYRRPTPLRTRLQITAQRVVDGDRIRSEAELRRGDDLLCRAEMSAVAGRHDELPAVSPRRVS